MIAALKRNASCMRGLLLASLALLFASSCQNDRKSLVGPALKAKAHVPDANPGSLCNTNTACPGVTELSPFGNNPTHYAVTPGTTVNGEIIGATDVPNQGLVIVAIKSSDFGNTTVTGIVFEGTITFRWDVPATGVCGTTDVAYASLGHVSNNDIIDDGLKNGTGVAQAGYAIVDASGNVISDADPSTPGCQGGTT